MGHINWLEVLVAAVVIFVLGWLWYSPLLFMRPWMRLRGIDPDQAMAAAGGKMPLGKMAVEFLRCFVLALIVTRFAGLLGVTSVLIAIHFGLMIWIGFPVVLLVGSVIWDGVNWKVAAIHAGDWFVKLLVLSILATVWR